MLSKVFILERGYHANCLRRTRPVEIARGKPKFNTIRPADWRQIDVALRQIYESDFSGRLGSSFLGAHLTTRIGDGAVGPESLAMPALVFDSVWLFDPVYSLISDAAG